MVEETKDPTQLVSAFEGFSSKVNNSIEALNNGIITQKEACENIEIAISITQNKSLPPGVLFIIEE